MPSPCESYNDGRSGTSTVAEGDYCTLDFIDDKTHLHRLLLPLDHFSTLNKEGDYFMSTHEFDAYCETQDFTEPDYHEQLLALHEFEEKLSILACSAAR